jgi:hypothetical protein
LPLKKSLSGCVDGALERARRQLQRGAGARRQWIVAVVVLSRGPVSA